MIYKVKDGFIVRRIGNQIMAVPVGRQTTDIHGVIALSKSGELLWNALVSGADIEALADILTENYDVDRDTAKADTERFLDGLKQQGALV
ncbi:MAG: PqqD family protein [Clostridia bacterium]|nr:PqqD family protein [Clostridia bacterium]